MVSVFVAVAATEPTKQHKQTETPPTTLFFPGFSDIWGGEVCRKTTKEITKEKEKKKKTTKINCSSSFLYSAGFLFFLFRIFLPSLLSFVVLTQHGLVKATREKKIKRRDKRQQKRTKTEYIEKDRTNKRRAIRKNEKM